MRFFFKQWGGVRKHLNGRQLDGRTYDAAPSHSLNPIPIDSKRFDMIGEAEEEASRFVAINGLAGD